MDESKNDVSLETDQTIEESTNIEQNTDTEDNLQEVVDIDGYFNIEIDENDVYLSVFGNKGNGVKVKFQDVREALRNREIKEYDKELVQNAVREHSEEKILIGKYFPRSADVEVDILNNGLEAVVKVNPPAPGGEDITKEMFDEALRKSNVTLGIKEDIIKEIISDKKYNKVILIAQGIPAKTGADAKINYKIDLERKPRFKADEYTENIDLREMNLIENVVKDQLLAVKTIAGDGEPGMTVQNKVMPPIPGKDVPIPAGKNTRVSEDGLELFSTVDGMVCFTGGKIDIEPVYVVAENVNTKTGNINFIGSVVVNGSVEDGFRIKSEGNIDIKKIVGAARLEAEGDIIVEQGIVGHNEAVIIAGSDVKAKHIQESTVRAGEKIVVSEAIMHSKVEAGEKIILYGKKALIVGGTSAAFSEINAKTIGSPMFTKTEIEVGISPSIREELFSIENMLKKNKEKLNKVGKGLEVLLKLKKTQPNLSAEKEKMIIQFKAAGEVLKKSIFDLEERYNEVDEKLKLKSPAKICVSNNIYPGVKIVINRAQMHITKKYTYVTFFEKDGEIKTRNYEEPRIRIQESV